MVARPFGMSDGRAGYSTWSQQLTHTSVRPKKEAEAGQEPKDEKGKGHHPRPTLSYLKQQVVRLSPLLFSSPQ